MEKRVIRCPNCAAVRGVPSDVEIEHRQKMVALHAGEERLPEQLRPRAGAGQAGGVLKCWKCGYAMDVTTAYTMTVPSGAPERVKEDKWQLLEVR